MTRPNFSGPPWLYPIALCGAAVWFGAIGVTACVFGLLMGNWPGRKKRWAVVEKLKESGR
jgi:hypothetical protein